jgi:hypothetical protein
MGTNRGTEPPSLRKKSVALPNARLDKTQLKQRAHIAPLQWLRDDSTVLCNMATGNNDSEERAASVFRAADWAKPAELAAL